jgi:hypothetical protein
MMANNPRTRTLCRRACFGGLVMLFALAGCKSKDGGSSSTAPRDPLVYGPSRIPPQNVPLPDRTGVGVKGTKSDPLLDRPVSQNGGSGYSADPSRFTGTYIPGVGSTPAALAAKGKDSDELKIDTPVDNRVPLKPAGGVQPAAAIEASSDVQPLYGQLQKYGIEVTDRSLTKDDEGKFVFRASVPIGNGTKREYNGVGSSANDAVKQVLDQVVGDRK